MAAPNIPEGRVLDERGELTVAWRRFLNEILRLLDEYEARITELEP